MTRLLWGAAAACLAVFAWAMHDLARTLERCARLTEGDTT